MVRIASMVGKRPYEGLVGGSSTSERGTYAPIAAISGRMPMMFMTLVRL
jgi:hypothetical protein